MVTWDNVAKQTCHVGDMPQGAPNLKVTWPHSCKSRDKLRKLHLHLHMTYEHQARQVGQLLWKVLTFKVTRLFDHVTNMRSHQKLNLLSSPSQVLQPLNLAWCWLQRGRSPCFIPPVKYGRGYLSKKSFSWEGKSFGQIYEELFYIAWEFVLHNSIFQ